MIHNGEVHIWHRAQHTSKHGLKCYSLNIRSCVTNSYYDIKYILKSRVLISRSHPIKYCHNQSKSYCSAMQMQTRVTAHFSSELLLRFAFAWYYCIIHTCICTLIHCLQSYNDIDTVECSDKMCAELSHMTDVNNISVAYTGRDTMYVYRNIEHSRFVPNYFKNVFQDFSILECENILYFSPLLDCIIPNMNKYLLISAGICHCFPYHLFCMNLKWVVMIR